MIITIPTFKAFMYSEVWEIKSRFPSGEIKNIQSTETFIKTFKNNKLDNLLPTYTLSSVSITQNKDLIELNLVDIEQYCKQ